MMYQTQRHYGHRIGFIALCLMICCNAGLAHEAGATGLDRPGKNAIGACVGVPQTFALTYERILGSRLSTRVHIGTAVLLSSAGARIQLGHNRDGLRPYFFAGATLIHAVAGDYGNPDGTAGYIWLGPGMNLRLDRWSFYAEVSALLGGDDDAGLGDDWIFPFSPAVTVGIMIYF